MIKSNGDLQYLLLMIHFCLWIWNCRYFDALSKGETPPVKDRLEFQLGQPMEKPLTQGLLAVLHKQVSKNYHTFLLIHFYIIYFGVFVLWREVHVNC